MSVTCSQTSSASICEQVGSCNVTLPKYADCLLSALDMTVILLYCPYKCHPLCCATTLTYIEVNVT